MNPKILHLDIETAPNLVYAWGLWGQDIHINQIVEPGYTLCWAAKWHNKRGVQFSSFHDKKMITKIHALLEEADIVCHYNGKKFDIPHLNKAFVQNEISPPDSYHQIDLLSVVRRQFKYSSNKLDHIADQLGLGTKVKHTGMELWRDCMDKKCTNHKKAWALMKKYNKQDVVLLEKLYIKLLPWIQDHPNLGLWMSSESLVCKNCGSDKLKRNGKTYKSSQYYQRYRCLRCRTEMRGNKTLKPKELQVVV